MENDKEKKLPIFITNIKSSLFSIEAVLSIYFKHGRLPGYLIFCDKIIIEPGEVVFCSNKTTQEELEIFLRRFVYSSNLDSIFCLVDVHKLSYTEQKFVHEKLFEMVKEKNSRILSKLILVSGKLRTAILSLFSNFFVEVNMLPVETIRKHVEEALKFELLNLKQYK